MWFGNERWVSRWAAIVLLVVAAPCLAQSGSNVVGGLDKARMGDRPMRNLPELPEPRLQLAHGELVPVSVAVSATDDLRWIAIDDAELRLELVSRDAIRVSHPATISRQATGRTPVSAPCSIPCVAEVGSAGAMALRLSYEDRFHWSWTVDDPTGGVVAEIEVLDARATRRVEVIGASLIPVVGAFLLARGGARFANRGCGADAQADGCRGARVRLGVGGYSVGMGLIVVPILASRPAVFARFTRSVL